MRLKRYFCYERSKRNYFSACTVKPDSSQISQNSTPSPCNASHSGHTTSRLVISPRTPLNTHGIGSHLTGNHSLQNSSARETDKKIRLDRPPTQQRQGTSNRGQPIVATNRDVHGQNNDKVLAMKWPPPRAPTNVSTWMTRGANSSITETAHWWHEWQDNGGSPL